MRRSEFDRATRDERKAGLKALVDSGRPPGVLAYIAGEPIAWVAISPRESFPPLERSRTLPRVDDAPVWSIVCFYVAREWRHKGLMVDLLWGVVQYAGSEGATIVEGYPTDPPGGTKVQGGTTGFMGLASAFRKAGFVEVLGAARSRPAGSRTIMRYYISGVSIEQE